MPFSFEHWEQPTAPETEQAFPFSEDLKELEASLAMGFAESMSKFRPETDEPAVAGGVAAPVLDDAHWDALAKVVADHVLTYMQEVDSPLQRELDRQRRISDEYYRDNRAMAEQIRQLLLERERLHQTIQAYEADKAHYRHLMGNLYLRL